MFCVNRYVPASSHDASGDAALYVPHGCRRCRWSSSRIRPTCATANSSALPSPFTLASHDESSGSSVSRYDERHGSYSFSIILKSLKKNKIKINTKKKILLKVLQLIENKIVSNKKINKIKTFLAREKISHGTS